MQRAGKMCVRQVCVWRRQTLRRPLRAMSCLPKHLSVTLVLVTASCLLYCMPRALRELRVDAGEGWNALFCLFLSGSAWAATWHTASHKKVQETATIVVHHRWSTGIMSQVKVVNHTSSSYSGLHFCVFCFWYHWLLSFFFFFLGQDLEKWIQCMYISNDSCRYRFQIGSHSSQTEIHVSTRPGTHPHQRTHTHLFLRSLPLLPLLHCCTLVNCSQRVCCQCNSCILHFLQQFPVYFLPSFNTHTSYSSVTVHLHPNYPPTRTHFWNSTPHCPTSPTPQVPQASGTLSSWELTPTPLGCSPSQVSIETLFQKWQRGLWALCAERWACPPHMLSQMHVLLIIQYSNTGSAAEHKCVKKKCSLLCCINRLAVH